MNKNSPLKVYIVVGHLGWLIVGPLLLFIGGGSWLANRFDWPDWTMIVFVLLGLVVMGSGLVSYVRTILNTYDDLNDTGSGKTSPIKIDKRDYDY